MDTDTDTDMEIPLPEELELLESNYHLEEDNLDLEPPEPYPEEEREPSPPPAASPISDPPLHSEAQINSHKRLRSDDPGVSNLEKLGLSEEKRSRIDELVTEPEEDWLRYSPPQENNYVVAEQVNFEKEKILSRFVSEIDGDCIAVTAPDGDRVYAKICRVGREERLKKLDVKAHSGGLILEPINILLQRLEQEAFTKTLQASSECRSDIIPPETPIVHEKLWVDKYAPNSFTELLSDEQTNREVLLWLKQWDSCVFGSEIRSTSDEVLSALKRHSSVAQRQKPLDLNFLMKNGGPRWNYGRSRHSKIMDENGGPKGIQESGNKRTNITGPPEHKILLLCGPPGLGKTTLAHVAAKHCGYHVVEVNASDDRSSSSIEAKILDVVQMNSVMSDSRPKCLVIDEIDGALGDGKGAVEVILKMVQSERKSELGKENFAKEEHSVRKSTKKGRKTASLCRPVICICNDLYAPVLRPLRQVAKVHVFVQPTVSRVVSRLKFICNKEGMKTNSIALTALGEYTECDIRSCLNTLQFLSKKKETLNVFDISSQVVGQKDISRNVLDIWKEVFQRKKAKRERRSHNSCSSTSMEFDFLHSLISYRGDYDLILDGIHENILQLQYHDPLMQKTVKCFDSLVASDLIHQYVMRTQQMPLKVYMPSMAIIAHSLVAQVQKPNIEWPRSYQRYRMMLAEKMEILKSWHYKIPAHIARHLSASSFVEDLISPLLHILSPPTLRPVALQLLSEKEKNDLTQLVSIMISYCITYKNVKSDLLPINLRCEADTDRSALSFDPSISDFINFKDYMPGHYVLSLALKQVLVHEVEKQKILQVKVDRSLIVPNQCTANQLDFVAVETDNASSAKIDHAAAVAETQIENAKNILKLQQCNANNLSISSNLGPQGEATGDVKSSGNMKKLSTCFFDRFRKSGSKGGQSNDKSIQKVATMERDSRPLIFKFNEGFTNAVKRPVRIREFLL